MSDPGGKKKDDVTFDDQIYNLLSDEYVLYHINHENERNQDPKADPNNKKYIFLPPGGGEWTKEHMNYGFVSKKENRVKFYNILKKDDSLRLKGYSYVFAAWIYDGLKETKNSAEIIYEGNDDFIPNNNDVTYIKDIRPLFTDCDQWNMKEFVKMFDLHNYDEVKNENFKIYYHVKIRNMPKGGPMWSDKDINLFAAWMYEGSKEKLTNEVGSTISRMVPRFTLKDNEIDKMGYPLKPEDLSFTDHIGPMFSEGHRNKMHDVRGFLDFEKYESVNKYKVLILDRLTRPDLSTRMPKNNPWPKKNIYAFYAWAIQGKNSREDVMTGPTDPYDENDDDYIKMTSYFERYRDLADIYAKVQTVVMNAKAEFNGDGFKEADVAANVDVIVAAKK
ncbi:hypothetical protein F8M41_005064 [Gigaspora margarita]|uniref:Uncharacterized protein n=1 Tax=Gigaspora margarita TaxID=4874 RepID=A0A8H3X9F0_GIGMA|nr:hypothetical protein F8M41_005064 [Gigaspora margarita]